MLSIAVLTDHIRDLDVAAVAALTTPELACIADDLAEQKASLGLIEDKLRAALDQKYGARAAQRRAEEAKDTGTVRLEDNGFVVVADLPKTPAGKVNRKALRDREAAAATAKDKRTP